VVMFLLNAFIAIIGLFMYFSFTVLTRNFLTYWIASIIGAVGHVVIVIGAIIMFVTYTSKTDKKES
jgi:uncharacterized membrane protein